MKKARQLAEKEEVSKTKGKGKMMKSLFTAILIAVVSISVFAAEYYVYDYKASIKRLDYVLTTKKVSKVDTVIQKYKVASDTIKGYIVVPACIYCTTAQDGAESSIGMASEGWFVRVGDKLSAKEMAIAAGVPIIPVYISSRFRLFHRVRVRVGAPMDIQDIKAQGVNSDTIKLLCDRIRETFYGLRDADNQA